MSDKIPSEIKKAISEYADCRDRKDAVISDVIFGYLLASKAIDELKKQLLSADAQNLQQSESLQLLHKTIDEKDKEIEKQKMYCNTYKMYCNTYKSQAEHFSDDLAKANNQIAEQQKRIDELEKEKERLKKAEILRRYAGGKH
jgi:uncharacterized protein (DUF3084 family)